MLVKNFNALLNILPSKVSVFFLAQWVAITRSDAYAVVVAELGFKPLSSAGRETGRFPPAMRQGCRIGRNTCVSPCPLTSGIKALVCHGDRMAEDVSRGPSYPLGRPTSIPFPIA